jgi:hypothetical protein
MPEAFAILLEGKAKFNSYCQITMGNIAGSYRLEELAITGQPPAVVQNTCYMRVKAKRPDDGKVKPKTRGTATYFGGCNLTQTWTLKNKETDALFGYIVGCPKDITIDQTPTSVPKTEPSMDEDNSISVKCTTLPVALSVTFLRQIGMSAVIILGSIGFIWGLLKFYRHNDATTMAIYNV